MAKHPFLSDEWFVAVRALHDAHANAVPPEASIRMNLRVTDTPFGEDRTLHMTAEAGRAEWGDGHLEDGDLTLTLAYEVAREIFVGGNPESAIEAFMAGKIVMQGDITKLMAMQAVAPGLGTPALTQALLEITE